MPVQDPKALMRRFYIKVWNRGDVEFAHEVFAADYVLRNLAGTRSKMSGGSEPECATEIGHRCSNGAARFASIRPRSGR